MVSRGWKSAGRRLAAPVVAGAVLAGVSSAAAAQSWKVGDKVEVNSRGSWYPAEIVEVRADGYKIHYVYFASSYDEVVDNSRIRAAGGKAPATPATPVPTSGASPATPPAAQGSSAKPGVVGSVVPGDYNCVSYIRNQGLVHTGAFSIKGGGQYADMNGKRGTYTFDAASATLTFRGGAYDGQRAEYENTGRPTLHILSERGRRVMDCDGPK